MKSKFVAINIKNLDINKTPVKLKNIILILASHRKKQKSLTNHQMHDHWGDNPPHEHYCASSM
ncbi:MAG: hypothetical protein HY959_03630 [Ignavibacteriae bacterium]|nr:hypothetical protein [Ignavibacteriota bacterium]